MSSNSWTFTHDPQAPRTVALTTQKRAEEIAAEDFERAEKRRLAFAELKSEFSSPADRIRAWEKLHGLRLPVDAGHAILSVVARCTALTLAQVRDEQRARNERVPALVSAPSAYGQSA